MGRKRKNNQEKLVEENRIPSENTIAMGSLQTPRRLTCAIKFLEYLQHHTDAQHPLSVHTKLKDVDELKPYFGDDDTVRSILNELAFCLNFSEFGSIKPANDWRIHFDDFDDLFSQDYLEDDDIIIRGNGVMYGPEIKEEEQIEKQYMIIKDNWPFMRVNNLYYNHVFAIDEVSNIVNGIYSSRSLDTLAASKLAAKVKHHLASSHNTLNVDYVWKSCEADEFELKRINHNMLIIQRAIEKNVKIAFMFKGYVRDNTLRDKHKGKTVLTPYYILNNNGKFYLLGCKEVEYKGEIIRKMSIWRIDLMDDIVILNNSNKKEYNQRSFNGLDKSMVENLPSVEELAGFHLKNINMSFDKPEIILLRVMSPKDDATKESLSPDYTFLHDWFGNNFKYIETESIEPFADIVEVECSPFGIVNWALQYSDRVEVLAPENVRNEVIKKIKNLKGKYKIA